MPGAIRMRASIVVVAWFAIATTLAATSDAAPILRSDPSFGRAGLVEPKLPGGYGYTSFLSAEVEPDGSVLAARQGKSSPEFGTTLRRYGADGRLDRGFRPQSEEAKVEAVDTEGKTLVAGSDAVERFEPDGERDPTFGIEPADGKPYSDVLAQTIEAVLPLPDGKIMVASAVRRPANLELEEVVVSCLDHQGRRDPGFGKDGEINLKSAFGIDAGELVGLARHGDGVIVVLDEAQGRLYEGQVQEPGGSILLALGADGRPDPAYGNDGLVRSGSSITNFAEGAEGSLLLTGDQWGARIGEDGQRASDIYAERLTPAGRPDPSFGRSGVATVDFGGLDLSETMLVGADGSILIGGATTPIGNSVCLRYESFCRETPVLVRLTADGAPDLGFGAGGDLRLGSLAEPSVSFGMGRGVEMLTALPGGGVLAGGGSGTAAFLVEFDAGGGPVRGFGRDGVVVERDRTQLTMEPRTVGTDGRGRIYVAAATNADALFSFEDTAILRFLPDGRLDRSYGHGSGFVRVPGNARAMVIHRRGDIYMLGTDRIPNFVEHVGPSGALERSFGKDGVALLPDLPKAPGRHRPQFQEFQPRSIAITSGGDVLVGGERNVYGGRSRIVVLRLDRRGRLDRRFGRRGYEILPFGPTGECNMTELTVRPDGHILIAARIHDRGEGGRRPALVQLLADGSPDPAFGEGGISAFEPGHQAVGKSLRILADGSVLLSGRQEIRGVEQPLLLRFARDGRLDRAFARTEQATVRASSASTSERGPVEILATPGRIFTVEKYGGVFAYSPRGALEAAIPIEAGRKPPRSLRAGTLQRGSLLLLGGVGRERGLFLRRYLP
jgi:uncharacterized delta-60 repeat protein